MKEALAQLIIELKDNVSAGLNKVQDAYKSLKEHIVAIGVALAAVGAVVMKSIEAYGQQREAVAKLDNALNNMGLAGTGASQRLQDLANALSKSSIFADEDIVSMQALLATYGLNERAIAQLTPRILNMASVTGDLNSAAMIVGKTLQNDTPAAFSKTVTKIDETAFAADALGTVTKALDKRFADMATTIAGEPLGRIKQMKNAWDEVMEAIGGLLIGPATVVIQWLTDLAGKLVENQTALQGFVDGVVYIGESIVNVFTFVGELIGTFIAALYEDIAIIQKILTGDFAGAMEMFKNASQVNTDSVKKDFDNLVKKQLDSYKKMSDSDKKKIAEEKVNYGIKLKDQKDFLTQQEINHQEDITKEYKRIFDRDKKHKEEDDRRNKEKLADISSTLSTISTLQESHEKSLFVMGKAAALANAIVNTAQGVSKAWSAGPFLGPALAAMVAVAGAVQIHKIAATGMAEGGIVMPTNGGILANIGEGDYPEAVIPLNDSNMSGMLGNNITVNINAGVIVADDESLRRFAEKIDEKLYSLHRNNQTVAI